MTYQNYDEITDKIRKKYPNWSSGVIVGSFTQLYNNLVMDHTFDLYTIFRYGYHHLVLVHQYKENSVIHRTFHYYYKDFYQDLIEINSNEFELDIHEKLEELRNRD